LVVQTKGYCMRLTCNQELKYLLMEKLHPFNCKVERLLPYENEPYIGFLVTPSSVHNALYNPLKDEFVEKIHGNRSHIKECRRILKLLNAEGLFVVVGQNMLTMFLLDSLSQILSKRSSFQPCRKEMGLKYLLFALPCCTEAQWVMHENNWLSVLDINSIASQEFINGSIFKSLSRNFLLEIIELEPKLKSEFADDRIVTWLKTKAGLTVLHQSIKFNTCRSDFFIDSELYFNLMFSRVENSYHLQSAS